MAISGLMNVAQYSRQKPAGFWKLLEETGVTFRWIDFLVLASILCFGSLQFYSCQHVSGFQHDDVFYADAGQNLVRHGYYGIEGRPEPNQPPGLPTILGLLCLARSCSTLAMFRAMVIFEVLGFLATYELLRSQVSRAVAASICILLISSQLFFSLATQWVFPCYPYFFTSISALLAARRLERSETLASRMAWGTLLTLLIVASLMFASAAMAFLFAIVATTALLYRRNRERALARLKLYFAVFLISGMVQASWMSRKVPQPDWPLPGYPQSYLTQLKVKNGNQPEMGTAGPSDIPVRVFKNARDYSALLSEMVLRRWISPPWTSVLVAGPIVLLLLGWASCVWRRGGGIQEWYFAAYQLIYVLWPWKAEVRFFLPAAPLACFYIWRGGATLSVLARNRPRVLGAAMCPLAVILAAGTWVGMRDSSLATHVPHFGLQDKASLVFWCLSAILFGRMLWSEGSWQKALKSLRDWFSRGNILGITPLGVSKGLGLVAVASLILIGLESQIKLARANLDPKSPANRIAPDVMAAEWINSHTPADAIVMARHVPISYHYSGRETLWFPPSSNPQLLIAGIQEHRISYAIVIRRSFNYYLPSDDDCMAPLLAAYPSSFELVYEDPSFRIFRYAGNKGTSRTAELSGAR